MVKRIGFEEWNIETDGHAWFTTTDATKVDAFKDTTLRLEITGSPTLPIVTLSPLVDEGLVDFGFRCSPEVMDRICEAWKSLKAEQTSEAPSVTITWVAEDVQTLRPSWSLEKCEEELRNVSNRLQDRSIETGWEILEQLVGSDESSTAGLIERLEQYEGKAIHAVIEALRDSDGVDDDLIEAAVQELLEPQQAAMEKSDELWENIEALIEDLQSL